MPEKRVIGLDARLLGRRHAGLGRYIKNLALRLPFVVPNHWQLVYFVNDPTQWAELIAALGTLDNLDIRAQVIFEKIKVVKTPITHYSWTEQTQLPAVFAAEKLDLLHVPHFNVPWRVEVPHLVVTIHDLLWHEKKGLQVTTLNPLQYYFKYAAYRWLTRQVVKKAQLIITPSETIRETVTRYYPHSRDKIRVIYNGVSDWARLTGSITLSQDLPANYLLYVGSLYPHKNVALLLQLLQSEPELQLVIVSARNAFWQRLAKQIADLKLHTRVHLRENITDEQLYEVYERAVALVQPSFSEGFGLTGVEAMKVGTPVLASDIPVFREIYGESFLPFNPHHLASLQAAYQKLMASDPVVLTRQAHERASLYSWEKMARQVVDVYREAFGDDK